MARSSGSTGSPRTGTNHPFVLSVSKDVNGWGLAIGRSCGSTGSPRTGTNHPFVQRVEGCERMGACDGRSCGSTGSPRTDGGGSPRTGGGARAGVESSVRPERVEGCGRAGSMNGHQPSVRPERVEGCGRAGSMNGHQPSVRPEPVEGCERNGRRGVFPELVEGCERNGEIALARSAGSTGSPRTGRGRLTTNGREGPRTGRRDASGKSPKFPLQTAQNRLASR